MSEGGLLEKAAEQNPAKRFLQQRISLHRQAMLEWERP